MDELMKEAKEAGFNREEVEFLLKHFAMKPHTHEIEDIESLPEILNDLGIEEGEES